MELHLLLLALLLAPADEREGDEARAELRALRGCLGLYAASLERSGPTVEDLTREVALELRSRLERFLDRPDLSAEDRAEAIEVFRGLARAMGRHDAPGETAGVPREVYEGLLRRAAAAAVDTFPLELEMLESPRADLTSREVYARLERLLPRLQAPQGAIAAADAATLSGVLRRLLSDRAWPDLESGEQLSTVVELLVQAAGGSAPRQCELVAAKLADWTRGLLREEAAREGELSQGAALLHLYRTLELAATILKEEERANAVQGLVEIAAPAIADGPPACEGALKSVEIGEVRIAASGKPPQGAPLRLPPLSAAAAAGRARYLVVPRKFYQVELVATSEGTTPRAVFWVLARAGFDSRIVLPRCIPQGMVPITSPETGRVAYLADRTPWSVRRFLHALQRSGSALAGDQAVVQRLREHTALRGLPLPAGAAGDFNALVGLLESPAAQEHLEGTFWVEASDEKGRAAAFEIAASVLSNNAGFRETALSLPTTAEANRLVRDGERFGLDKVWPASGLGLFNATRLVPEPRELGERPRYAVRAVLRLPAP